MASIRSTALVTCIIGCGPQVAPSDDAGEGPDDGTGAPVDSASRGDDSAPTTSGSAGSTRGDDSSGITGEPLPTQTWCIDRSEFQGSPEGMRVLDLDGGGSELWWVSTEVDRRTKASVTHFTVRQFEDRTLTDLDAFSRPMTVLAFGDVDGDGLDDAIGYSGVPREGLWLPGQANGRISEAAEPFAFVALESAYGDHDGDGALDAVLPVGGLSPVVEVHLGDGTGAFSPIGSIDLAFDDSPFYLDTHEMADGTFGIFAEPYDLGFGGDATAVVLVRVSEAGTLSELGRFWTSDAVRPLGSMDRNRDGLPDVLLESRPARPPRRIAWYESPGYRETIHVDPSSVVVARDFDLDGLIDVIERFGFGEPTTIRFGLDGVGLGPPQPLVGDLDLPAGTSGDLDGDGRLDLVSRTDRSDVFSIWNVMLCDG